MQFTKLLEKHTVSIQAHCTVQIRHQVGHLKHLIWIFVTKVFSIPLLILSEMVQDLQVKLSYTKNPTSCSVTLLVIHPKLHYLLLYEDLKTQVVNVYSEHHGQTVEFRSLMRMYGPPLSFNVPFAFASFSYQCSTKY